MAYQFQKTPPNKIGHLRVRFPNPDDAARHVIRTRGIGRAKAYAVKRVFTCGDSNTEWWTDVLVTMRLILEPPPH